MSLSKEQLKVLAEQLEAKLKEEFTYRPDRGEKEWAGDSGITWRHGAPPDYTLADIRFLEGRTMNHPEGSTERFVETLVKKWEFEASHKPVLNEWTTVCPAKYRMQANGGRIIEAEEALNQGNYSVILGDCESYRRQGMDFKSSHEYFRANFPNAFPWELIEMRTETQHPPEMAARGATGAVAFSWRHWGDIRGTGRTLEVFGLARVELHENAKIGMIQVYMEREKFMEMVAKGEGVARIDGDSAEYKRQRAAILDDLWAKAVRAWGIRVE